ncbi:MAG: purine-nucleoside phosphorylase [Planctomycetia bacterium]|nr:purine-nucleoside phosphorylase [Planctomycetia bacterium]
MLDLAARIDDAAATIAGQWARAPRAAIILGTGQGRFASQIDTEATIPYESIPHFPRSTVLSHKGQLVCGTLCGVPVVTMEGRCHAYEGYSLADTTLAVRVMKALGARALILTNASGGMNPYYAQGDIVVIEDHINLLFDSPLLGPHDDAQGDRFVDLSGPYDERLASRALEIARREGFAAHRGVYAALKGPNLETRAEYRFLRAIGADVVGMSTVPEVIVAAQIGLRVLALSTVTNVCLPDALRPASAEAIVAVAEAAEPRLRQIVLGVVADELQG